MPKQELYNIIIKYFLYYLKINKQHTHKKKFVIKKKINIYITKFTFKENKKINRYNQAY